MAKYTEPQFRAAVECLGLAVDRMLAAEGRVEAAEAELRVRSQVHRDEIDGTLFKLGETQRELAELRAMLNAPTGEVWAVCRYANGFWHVIEDEDDEPLARAALACPPPESSRAE